MSEQGRLTFRWPWTRTKEPPKPITAKHLPGLFRRERKTVLSEATPKSASESQSQSGTNETVWVPQNLSSYYDSYYDYDYIRQPIDDLAESAFGGGYYTTVDEDDEENPAKKKVDEFGEFFNLDCLLPNIGKEMLIAGFCPVETQFGVTLEKSVLKIIHPPTVKKIYTDPNARVTRIEQQVSGASQGKMINAKDFAWFMYDPLGNDPRGVSLVRGAMGLLNTMQKTTDDVSDILDRYISPMIIWMARRSIEALEKAVLEKDVGEDIFLGDLTDMTPEDLNNLCKVIQIDADVPFWDYIMYDDRRLYSYFRANNLWYSKDATLASAETLDTIVTRHVRSIQRSVKRVAEDAWFKPLSGGKDVPRLNYGVEMTGVEDVQIEPFLTAGLTTFDANGAYLTRKQYYDILQQLSVSVIEDSPEPFTQPLKDEDGNVHTEGRKYEINIK